MDHSSPLSPPSSSLDPTAASLTTPLPTEPTEIATLPPTHFLSLARNPFRDLHHVVSAGIIDTSTVAAADFDVDARSGFMPPAPPVARFTDEHQVWETVLDNALGDGKGLQLGELATTDEEREKSELWRASVREMPILSITSLRQSEVLLRRAHHVLAFILHLYIHSQPPLTSAPPHPPYLIPAPLSVPLFALSAELALPPILTYSDNVLYNWSLIDPHLPVSQHNIRMEATFSLTPAEKHFYITSARIELRGVEALEIMRSCMDEAFIGDRIAQRRITAYLQRLAVVIDDLTTLLLAVKDACDPGVFYDKIRPWFRGWQKGGREWLFEGVDPQDAQKYARMSGPSAGQSALIHALDIFLGVDHTTPPAGAVSPHADPGFLMRMEQYMPRHHRAFLQHLRTSDSPTTIRALITGEGKAGTGAPGSAVVRQKLQTAYDQALIALKKFRDGHIRIAVLYIVSQARRESTQVSLEDVRGTGGTSLVPFLKECRDNTLRTTIASQQAATQ